MMAWVSGSSQRVFCFSILLTCLTVPSLSWGQVSTAQGSSSKGSASKGSSSKGSSTIALPGSTAVMEAAAPDEKGLATAVLAGGCFWCLESDFEKCPGVVDIVSGYSGGRSSNPTYENYSLSGHREVVLVTYSPAEITFTGICEWLVKHIDPTDPRGQFIDRGLQYSPAIYYETEDEKQAAQEVIKALKAAKVYGRKSVNLKVLPRVEFYPAEDYHQNYHSTHPTEYQNYRQTTGRDAFVTRIWGADSQRLQLPASTPSKPSAADEKERPWMAFKKPGPVELRESLTAIQYEVTQGDGTEPAFRNEYWDNKSEGLYVDVVSGAPLFSSRDKFKSGTGWPSFVRPIEADALTLAVDHKLGYARTEVRSRYGDSHLGHVFSDGPRDRGGKRYCMNSAAMRFIPVDKLESEGYGAYLEYFE